MDQEMKRAEEAPLVSSEKFQVELPQWTGPYDLLLKVISEQDLDLFDLDISKLLEHYLQYLEELKEINIDEAGEFLVVAATLAQIKSKMLLPAEEVDAEEDEVDPREQLVFYLQEYQKIKKAADQLRGRPLLGRDVFTKGLHEQFAGIETDGQGTLFQLVKGFQRALHRAQPVDDFEVEREEVSVSARFGEIIQILRAQKELAFDELLPENQGRSFLIASFLAVLELVRLHKVRLLQDKMGDRVFLELCESDSSNDRMESEFDYEQ